MQHTTTPYFLRRVRLGKPPYKLDLGCRDKRKEGYVGLDIRDCGQEILWDVRNGLPLPDNSVVAINMGDFLEHIGDNDQPLLWQEIRRVCQHEAVITTKTPHADTPEAWDVWHTSRWTAQRFAGLALCWNRGLRVKSCRRIGAHIIAELVVLKTREEQC